MGGDGGLLQFLAAASALRLPPMGALEPPQAGPAASIAAPPVPPFAATPPSTAPPEAPAAAHPGAPPVAEPQFMAGDLQSPWLHRPTVTLELAKALTVPRDTGHADQSAIVEVAQPTLCCCKPLVSQKSMDRVVMPFV